MKKKVQRQTLNLSNFTEKFKSDHKGAQSSPFTCLSQVWLMLKVELGQKSNIKKS